MFEKGKVADLMEQGKILELIKFNELEGKIKVLIEEYSFLKNRNQVLEELSEDKDEELERVNSKIKRLNEEWDAVRAKVDSLLDMLQDISVPQ